MERAMEPMYAVSSAMASWNASKSRIHSMANSWLVMSTLLKAITNGSRVLYMMLQAYIMFDINDTGLVQRGVSTT